MAKISSDNDPAFIRVANAIRDDILRGGLLSGASLIEAELAEVYGCSRNTLRESLQLLRQQGLVSQERNKSVRVKRLTEAELRDIFIVRRVLEPGALRGRSSVAPESLDRIGLVIQTEAEAIARGDWRAAATESLRFHQEIVKLHGSRLFDEMFALLVTQLRLIYVSGQHERAFQEPWIKREAEIHALIRDARFEDAADRLEAYLQDAEAMLSGLFESVGTLSREAV